MNSEQVFDGGEPQRMGSFRFFLNGQRWEWSDAVAEMHGYRPSEVTPTTEMVLSHKHPDDRPRVTRVLDRMINNAEPFSSKHRIFDTAGTVHHVVVIGDHLHDDTGTVIGTSGFYIDITDFYHGDVKKSVDEAVASLTESRAVIEQAKGALMLIYGIPADRAFDVLAWRSQQTNTRLRTLAEQLVTGLGECEPGPGLRTRFDHLLLTAHEKNAATRVEGRSRGLG
ncbi:PAS and ANTAR domain-containing protein [Rhodococcus sp. NPDC127530]|uniref:PAS and ANTAR domain-containing protein n=1 Tax=unclassified Rhodococcus (in: high G+C Gram-positive bacteria) TaxID=192944 RepID=UPI0036423CF0